MTSKNLNYAGIALAATVVLALAGWVLTARSWYTGPIRNVDTAQKTLSLADAYMKGECACNLCSAVPHFAGPRRCLASRGPTVQFGRLVLHHVALPEGHSCCCRRAGWGQQELWH